MKLIWTDFAIENLKYIFFYYSKNVSRKIAHKIRLQLLDATKQLIKHPESGQIESSLSQLNQDYRFIVCGNYKIIYRITDCKQYNQFIILIFKPIVVYHLTKINENLLFRNRNFTRHTRYW